ncbi:ribosomal protein L1 (plastid) [Cryptomonas paramecium]|uniref:Ribosomal protein n=1 Tax=Cryptomonas paramaecium TaxID=2898 RepID=D2ISC8_9CRYP|nr:ribosomal protein L1 [Cryptomonas paramecium]ACT46820.1 ribosomal protein L1 [Cryptomonas paramecium]BDA97975.1 ribosomal protein L1 [Cryptomonas paramecium]
MGKISKRTREIQGRIEKKQYKPIEAINVLKQTATAKFAETAEAHISLKLDTKHADQQLRSSTTLPNGTGKKIRIGVITHENHVKESMSAGADVAGSEDLIQEIMKGIIQFDKLIATPDMMPAVAKLGKILGPRGLMPSPKSGTVTQDVRSTIKEFRMGKLEYRADKCGIVHVPFGKANFPETELLTNLEAIKESIEKNRPRGAKGKYWKSFHICSTMGPSIPIDISGFQKSNQLQK